jgi:hypothetical protein
MLTGSLIFLPESYFQPFKKNSINHNEDAVTLFLEKIENIEAKTTAKC